MSFTLSRNFKNTVQKRELALKYRTFVKITTLVSPYRVVLYLWTEGTSISRFCNTNCGFNAVIFPYLQNGQKAQVWAFLLWKDSQIQQENPDKDATNPWKLYQKWCKMDTHIRDSWITAGKTIQTFTKISNAKMQDTSRQIQSNVTEGNVFL